ncbi:MAG: protein kinase [Hamadaea sp.]|nr:protein kinase [Hamadaea sp.]
MSGDAPPEASGIILGDRYRLIEPHARGSNCIVWHGLDERLGRPVAVKTVLSGTAEATGNRIQREAQAAARIMHPHIATTYDWGQHEGQPYVVMELADGTPLAHILVRTRQIPWQAAVACAAQVADALAALHARGLVHRDVTPANIILTADGVKLIDFGISAVEGEPELDADGNLRGTPAYAAPERLAEGAVESAGDVYSLGLLMYRMLSGRLPWSARSAPELLALQHTRAPDPLPAIAGLAPAIVDLCMGCLSRSPLDRPTAAQVAAALAPFAAAFQEALTSLPSGSKPEAAITRMLPRAAPEPVATPRRSLRRGVASAVGVTAIAASAWWVAGWMPGWTPSGDPQQPQPAVAAPPTRPHYRAAAPCVATYQVTEVGRRTFAAALSVRNTSSAVLTGWRLAFSLPGDQTLDGAVWRQAGRDVTIAAAQARLTPGAAHSWQITGRHPGTVQIPTTFRLDGQRCDVVLLAPGVGVSGVRLPPLSPSVTPSPEATEKDKPGNAVDPSRGPRGPKVDVR